MAKNEVKWGAILSYILIILNTFYGLIITPFIVGHLGDSEYGVYKTISSFTAALMVLDLGFGGTLIRYVSRFRADNEDAKIPNYIAMTLLQAGIVAILTVFIAVIGYFSLPSLFSGGFTVAELLKAKEIYVYLCLGMIAHIFENVFNGIIGGYNRFTLANGLKLLRLLIRAV